MSSRRGAVNALGPPAGAATASTPSALAVARAGLWTLFAAQVVAGWGTQWDIQLILLAPALLAALVMVAVDARRRPVLAALAYGLTLFVALGVVRARAPAFAQSLPSVLETAAAALLTALASLAGGVLARRATS